MATGLYTLLDLSKRLTGDGTQFAPIIEVLAQSNPILEDATFIEGDLPIGNKTTVRTSLPTPSIRRLNRGTAATKSSARQIIDVCMNLEDRSCIDVEALKGKPNVQEFRKQEDDAHIEGMGQFVAKVLMYGDLTNPEYAETFNGIFARYKEFSTVRGEPGAQMINAAAKAASGNKYCSAVFVDWGPRKVNGIYPKNTAAGVNMQDLGEGDAYDANGNAFRAVQTLFNWKVGLAVENYRSIAMVRNIETATLPTLDSDARRLLLDKLIYAKNRLMNPKAPVLYVPDTLYSALETMLLDKNIVHVTRDDRQAERPIIRLSGIAVKKLDCMAEDEAGLK